MPPQIVSPRAKTLMDFSVVARGSKTCRNLLAPGNILGRQRLRLSHDLRGVAGGNYVALHVNPLPAPGQLHSQRVESSLRHAPPPARCCPDRANAARLAAGEHYRDGASRWKVRPARTARRAASIRSEWPAVSAGLHRQRESRRSGRAIYSQDPTASQETEDVSG